MDARWIAALTLTAWAAVPAAAAPKAAHDVAAETSVSRPLDLQDRGRERMVVPASVVKRPAEEGRVAPAVARSLDHRPASRRRPFER